jgi:hypothetical protein
MFGQDSFSKRRQLDQISCGNRFNGVPSLAPGSEPSGDHRCVKSMFPQ